jgi:hypothetical protein
MIYQIGMDVANGAAVELLCASFTLRVNECSEASGFQFTSFARACSQPTRCSCLGYDG